MQLVAPVEIRDSIFEHLHTSRTAGHFGRDRTLETVSRRFYWPGMTDTLTRWCKSCDLCARCKPGPSRFGCPLQLHSDMAQEFEGKLFTEVCRLLDIKKTRTTPYRPCSNGLVERFNRTLKQMLSMYAHEGKLDWDDHLPFILMAYRASEHKSTGCTPNLMMLGREVDCPIDLMVGGVPEPHTDICTLEYVEWLRTTMQETFQYAHKHLEVAAKSQEITYDRNLKSREFQIGTWVWRWYPPKAGLKLELGWTGPYLVVDKLSSLTYKI
ncbi:uncharacterized protein LOC132544947 [Ylistrum balloti]|uniref:uncharacterized protein LOC132544947 n=1 Tax=Ylistrum balloti TaxID=509963 RepID=UPI002905EFD5|nr:uncharacterized protein LOC132544947 [Ylistrum balloti]